ncbi:signal peptidase II [Marinimicrobium alkaliphilum]|uniref:signal peptidase II n=1 Tax=Marinimicrobium alkaliphilum TaxID=2202654 RepID=UPI0038CC1B78
MKIPDVKAAWHWYLIAAVVVAVDLLTKYWASAALDYGEPVVFTPFFNFTLLHNPGAAFSFLSEAGGWQRWFFTVIAFVVSIVLVVWISRVPQWRWRESLGLSLILGGAVGNLWDRVVHGYVVDFIVVHYQDYYWPAFNIADSAITVGAGLLIIDMLMTKESARHA